MKDQFPLSTRCVCRHTYGHHSAKDDHCCRVGCDCLQFQSAAALRLGAPQSGPGLPQLTQ